MNHVLISGELGYHKYTCVELRP